MKTKEHDELIKDQFSRQALLFSQAKAIADEHALRLLVDFSQAAAGDRVLDVACGGGLVVCAFAQKVESATGIDITPAMLARACDLASEKKLNNVAWHQGDVMKLPFRDASFDIVVTRFSFHHFLQPLAVLREMVRVCKSGGRIVVADVVASEDQGKAAEFNRLELLRDPSHVRNLTVAELRGLFVQASLPAPEETLYELRDLLDNLLARSFPSSGDEAKIRDSFRRSIDDDRLGIPVRRVGDGIEYAYPVRILRSRKG
jgi:ubiquinone/menaquinone biosynthesis C-methylase UbiE